MQKQNFFTHIIAKTTFVIFLCAIFLAIAFISPSWSMRIYDDGEASPSQKISPLMRRHNICGVQKVKRSSWPVSEPKNTSCCKVKKKIRRASDNSTISVGKFVRIEWQEKIKISDEQFLASCINKYAMARFGGVESQTSSKLIYAKGNCMPIIREDAMEEERTVLNYPLPVNLNCRIYILLGYPGAGKGTFAEVLKGQGYTHLSTGNILREEVKNKTSFGLQYQQHIESSSQLLPTEIIESFLLKKVNLMIENKESFMLDGYPKTVAQAERLNELIERYSLHKNVRIIYLDLPLDCALERVKTRETCSDCEKIYNFVTAQPTVIGKCDLCGASLFHRTCDTEEGFQNRILLFNKTVKKVLNFYEEKGGVIKINSNIPLKDFTKQVLYLTTIQPPPTEA